MPLNPGEPQAPGQITGTREQQIQGYAAQIDQAYPPAQNVHTVNGKLVPYGPVIDLGQKYIAYMHAHPNASPWGIYELSMAQFYAVAHFGQSLGGTVAQMFGTQGKITEQFIKGVGAGAIDVTKAVDKNIPGLTGLAAIGDFFQRLTQAATWIRVAEVALGVGLLYVTVSALAKGTPAAPIVNLPKNVIKATPAGRAVSKVVK